MTFVYVGLGLIVFVAIVAGLVTFLPTGALQKLEDARKPQSSKRE